jgi:hypothetical protein
MTLKQVYWYMGQATLGGAFVTYSVIENDKLRLIYALIFISAVYLQTFVISQRSKRNGMGQ